MSDARARVRVTLEIEINGGAWGAECPVGEIYKQAVKEAQEIIARRFGVSLHAPGDARGEPVRATIIDMTPIAIITEGVKR
jgi:hypothetical protein